MVQPIILKGKNLGERHQYFNKLVKDALNKNGDFKSIQNNEENSPIDRLFKIDLASKIRNVDYIIENLKDNDILFVSKALRSTWLLEKAYEGIMNPKYLENKLYPKMITTAVTKIRNWLYINLRDEDRCKDFYQYYKDRNFNYSMKFYLKCSKQFIYDEFSNIVLKITPHYFKIICEKCPNAAEIFFDLISKSEELKSLYLNDENKYFSCIKYVLKSNSILYLDIVEKYQNMNMTYDSSPVATKYILRHHKDRFMKKSELYMLILLDMKTTAVMLNAEEVKDLIIKLARAKYLAYWFSYKTIEPLIKRVNVNERAQFKKKIFENRDFGTEIETWEHDTPSPPEQKLFKPNIFVDRQDDPNKYSNMGKPKRNIMKRKYCHYQSAFTEIVCCDDVSRVKTLLDKLYNEFRVTGFEKTLFELRKRIKSDAVLQNREFMILVLISKSGGRLDALKLLSELLQNHINEPANFRAAVVRSLVKRAFLWRVTDDIWASILKFAHGLGLDGKIAEANCIEGFHAVILRKLLQNEELDKVLFKKFLEDFTNFSIYSLNKLEKDQVSEALPKLLIQMAKESKPIDEALQCVENLIDTLMFYKKDIENYPDFKATVKNLVEKDFETCKNFLMKLYEMRIGRKEFFKSTFVIYQNNDSYVNALKHDISVIDFKTMVEEYKSTLKADAFLKKMCLYFGEDTGFAEQCLKEFKDSEIHKNFGRPLAILLRKELVTFIEIADASKENSINLSALLRANAHLSRPPIDINTIEWSKLGTKLIRNKLLICPNIKVEDYIEKLLDWKPTMKLAFELSKRVDKQEQTLGLIATKKTTYSIKAGLKLLKDNKSIDTIWKTIKPLIEDLDLSKQANLYLQKRLSKVGNIPVKIKPEYTTILYQLYKKLGYFNAMPYLCHIEIQIQETDDGFVRSILEEFLKNFNCDVISKLCVHNFNSYDHSECVQLHIRILFKYLLTAKSELHQKNRFDGIGLIFFNQLKQLLEFEETKTLAFQFLDEVLLTLKFTDVFLNSDYVSCIPVMGNIVKWLQEVLPMEKYIKQYIYVHLTMLYFKSLRQCVKNFPEVFKNEATKVEEGTKFVGNIFGKYITREVKELSEKYFESIIELYQHKLIEYLDDSFNYTESTDFLKAIIESILQDSQGVEYRLGMHLLNDKSYVLQNEKSNLYDIMKQKGNNEVQFFIFADID